MGFVIIKSDLKKIIVKIVYKKIKNSKIPMSRMYSHRKTIAKIPKVIANTSFIIIAFLLNKLNITS